MSKVLIEVKADGDKVYISPRGKNIRTVISDEMYSALRIKRPHSDIQAKMVEHKLNNTYIDSCHFSWLGTKDKRKERLERKKRRIEGTVKIKMSGMKVPEDRIEALFEEIGAIEGIKHVKNVSTKKIEFSSNHKESASDKIREMCEKVRALKDIAVDPESYEIEVS